MSSACNNMDCLGDGRFMKRYTDRYCHLGGGSSKQESQSSNKIDPQQYAMFMDNYGKANAVADTPFQAYTGERIAPFSPTQAAGQGLLSNIANSNIGADGLAQAKAGAQGIVNFQPQQILSPGALSPRTVSAPNIASPGSLTAPTLAAPDPVAVQKLSTTDLSPYLNPYTDSVVNSSLSDLERQRQRQQVADNQTATAAHTFGGTRQAVRDSLTSDDYLRNVASTTANLRSGAFDSARSAALADIAQQTGVNEFNTNLGYDASKTNAGYKLSTDQYNLSNLYDLLKTNAGYQFDASKTNAAAGNAADEFNLNSLLDINKSNAANDITGAGVRLNAGSQLANLSDAELTQALQKAGVLEGVGAEQTGQQQAQDDAAYAEFLRQIAYPIQQQQQRNAALGLIPIQQTTSGTETTKQSGGLLSSLSGILGGLGSLGEGLGAMGVSLSDLRSKKNVTTHHYDDKGRRWVEFSYHGEPDSKRHVGVIAQEILNSDPEAVSLGADGLYRVNYDLLKGGE